MAQSKPKTAAPPSRDPRRFIYVAIDVVFTIGYLIVLAKVLHNRHGYARAVLYFLPVATMVMAIGTAYGKRIGWWMTVGAGAGLLLWTVGFIILLLRTSAYLSGVYGAFGKAAASGVVLAVAFVVEFVAILPAIQLKWAMTRHGRRAYGLAPLSRAPSAPLPSMRAARS